MKILINRTDAIGDVVLTLPVCGLLKEKFPDVKIIFFGRSYTQPVINCCVHVDEFLNADELSLLPEKDQVSLLRSKEITAAIHVFPDRTFSRLCFKSGIPLRIGTTNRWHHWLYCNRLVPLSRKRSALHEYQLNIRLLEPLGIKEIPPSSGISHLYGLEKISSLASAYKKLLSDQKINIILHPKSRGHGREWGLKNFYDLIHLLPEEQFEIFITGSPAEHEVLKDWIKTIKKKVNDISGKLSLDQFIAFINESDGLIAAGTGPLHIAAALGKQVIGIYPSIKPVHAERWGPIGKRAMYLSQDKSCNACKNRPESCTCIREIEASRVVSLLNSWQKSTPGT